MRRIVNLKLCGIAYWGIDIIIQVLWLFAESNEWVLQYSLYNSFLALCFAIGIFGESKLLGWVAALELLVFVILSIYVLLTFIRRKGNFSIPLLMTLVNMIVHTITLWRTPILETGLYVGLLYKIIGCAIFVCIVYKDYVKRNNKVSECV